MRATITRTERQAVKQAKSELASQCNRLKFRASDLLIEHTSTRCVCGQTGAVSAWSLTHQKQSIVGYCNYCGESI